MTFGGKYLTSLCLIKLIWLHYVSKQFQNLRQRWRRSHLSRGIAPHHAQFRRENDGKGTRRNGRRSQLWQRRTYRLWRYDFSIIHLLVKYLLSQRVFLERSKRGRRPSFRWRISNFLFHFFTKFFHPFSCFFCALFDFSKTRSACWISRVLKVQ